MLLAAALAEHNRGQRGERRVVQHRRPVPQRHAADSGSTIGRRTCRRMCGLQALTLMAPLLPGALLIVLITYLDESSQIPAERYVAYPSRLLATGAVGVIVAVTGVAYALVIAALAASHRTPAVGDLINACRARAQAQRAAQLAAWRASLGDVYPTEREAHVWVSAYEAKVAEAWIAPARLLWTVVQLPAIAYAALLVVAHSEELWEWCYAHAAKEARCTVPYLNSLLPSSALWRGKGSATGLPELLLIRLAAMVLGCVHSLGASLAALCLGGRGLLQSEHAQCIGHAVVRRAHAAAWALSYAAVLCFDVWFNWAWVLTVRLECSSYVDVPTNATGATLSNAPTTRAPTSSSWYGHTPTGYPTAFPTPARTDGGGETEIIPSEHVAYDAWRACRWYVSTTQLLLYAVALIHLVRWLRFVATMPAVFTPDSIRARSEMFRRHAVLQCVYERACCCTPRFVAAQLREEWALVQEHARTRGRRFDAEDSARRTPRAIVEFEANTSMRRVLSKWRKRRPFAALALTLALRVDAMLGSTAGGGEGRDGADGRIAPLNAWTGMDVGGVELLVVREREERDRAASEAATRRVYRASEQEEALQSQVDALLRRARFQSEAPTGGAARRDVAAAAAAAAAATRTADLSVTMRVVQGDVEEGGAAAGTAPAADEYLAEGPAAVTDDAPIVAKVAITPRSPLALSPGRAISPSATPRNVDMLAIPSNFLCPITHEVMAHPAVLVGDGYSCVGATGVHSPPPPTAVHTTLRLSHLPPRTHEFTRWRIILSQVRTVGDHVLAQFWALVVPDDELPP